jgi:hypothetical protein
VLPLAALELTARQSMSVGAVSSAGGVALAGSDPTTPVLVSVTSLLSLNLSLSHAQLSVAGAVQVSGWCEASGSQLNAISHSLSNSTTCQAVRLQSGAALSVVSRGGAVSLGDVSGDGALVVVANSSSASVLALSTGSVGAGVNVSVSGSASVMWTASSAITASVLGTVIVIVVPSAARCCADLLYVTHLIEIHTNTSLSRVPVAGNELIVGQSVLQLLGAGTWPISRSVTFVCEVLFRPTWSFLVADWLLRLGPCFRSEAAV